MSRRELPLDILKGGCYISNSQENGAMTAYFVKKYIALHRSDIALFKFFLEGYDGIGSVTTVDGDKAVVEVTIMGDFAEDGRLILEALKDEIEFEECESMERKD
jgi:hypothetical protein